MTLSQERLELKPSERFIPFNLPSIGEEEKREVLDTLESGWLTTGPKTKRFEAEMADYTGTPHALAVNSCTAALHLAMVASGLKPGDEVITPSLTFPSACNEMVHEGITPVMADIEPDTLNLDISALEPLINERTRAVIPVHFNGHPVECDKLRALADHHGLLVLGDAAHATESTFRGKHICQWEDATSFSFYATKNLSTGEGGMLISANEEMIDQARLLALHGMSRDAWKRYTEEGYKHWEIVCPGFKYNMTDVAACLGLQQLKRLPGFTAARRRLTERYDEAFSDLPDQVQLLQRRDYAGCAYHLYVIQVKTENLTVDRDQILNEIQSYNIGVGVHFRALHLHAWYREHFGYQPGMLPKTEYAGDRVISLPLYPDLADEDQEFIIDVVRHLLKKYAR